MKNISKISIFALVLTIMLSSFQSILPQQNVNSQVINFHETVWLSSERHLYIPGESVLLSARIFETDTYRPSALSSVIRIELLDADGNQIRRQKEELDGGTTFLKLDLPVTLSTGWYYIRAYSNWMKNSPYLSNSILPVRVVNPGDIDKYLDNNKKEPLTVEMFNENHSGSIAGSERYALHITGTGGEPVAVKGILMNGTDTIASFGSDLSGWASTEAKNAGGGTFAMIDGYADDSVKLVRSPGNQPGLLITPNIASGTITVTTINTDNNKFPVLRLLVHSTGSVYWDEKKTGNSFSVPLSGLPGGIVQFTLLDNENNILARRLWVTASSISSSGKVTLDKSGYSYRETGEALLRSAVPVSQGINSIEVRVSRQEPLNPLDTYIPGLPGWSVNYEIPAGVEAREAWLAVRSYPDEVVENLLSDDPVISAESQSGIWPGINDLENSVKYIPETRGLSISGTVINTATSESIPNIVVGLTILSDNTFLADRTFSSGRFHFVLPDDPEKMDMVIAFVDRPDENYSIRIDPEFETTRQQFNSPPLRLTEEDVMFIRQLNIDQQINNIYNQKDSTAHQQPEAISPKTTFFGQPDFKIVIDRFIKLPNISELIYELVPFVATRKNGDIYDINVYGETNLPVIYRPAILLDGIPIYDFNDFLMLPPDRLRLVEVKNKMYIHGNAGFAGAVSFHSVNGDMAGLGLPKKSQLLTMDRAGHTIAGYFQDNLSGPRNKPILENTLLWEHYTGNLPGRISFTTNDNFGNFSLMLFGFNSSGQWVYDSAPFTTGEKKDSGNK